MAETAAERLNRLQMEDLGTARREYISTVDRQFRNTRVEVIEATRRSNLPGSDEQRVAEANRSRLEGWSNLHKEIGDTGEEHLDNLLNGQSHRLNLSNTLRPNGEQISGNHNCARSAQKGPSPRGPITNSTSENGGRQRPPQSKQHSGRTSTTTIQPVSQGGTALGLAVDVNNVVSKKDVKGQRPKTRSASSKGLTPETLTVRKLTAKLRSSGNFSRIISTPEVFLAAARNIPFTHGPAKQTNEQAEAHESAKADNPPAKNVSAPGTPSNPTLAPDELTAQSSLSLNPARKKATSDEELSTEPMSVDSLEGEKHQADFIDAAHRTQEEDSATDTKSQEPPVIEGKSPSAAPKPQETLVDLSLDDDTATASSPALEELKGLEFTQFIGPQGSPSGPASANRKLDFGEVFHEGPKTNVWDDAEFVDKEVAEEYQREIDIICQLLERTTISHTFRSSITECKKQLEFRLDNLRVSKQNMITRQLSTAPIPEPPVSAPEAQAVQVPAPEAPGAQAPVTRASAPQTPTPPPRKSSKAASPSCEFTPKPVRKISSNQTNTPSSQSRLNAAARPFSPSAFTQYRSLSNATSTDSSTIFQPTSSEAFPQQNCEDALIDSASVLATTDGPSSQSSADFGSAAPRVIPERSTRDSHSAGDNLLPGSRAEISEERVMEKVVEKMVEKVEGNIEGKGEGKMEEHIFGDHLLPGRRAVASSATRPDLRDAAAPKPFPAKFLNFPPRPSNSMPSDKIPGYAFSLTLKAPQTGPLNKALDAIPTNKPAATETAKDMRKTTPSTSMQESIYAPKLKEISASGTQRKSSRGEGLMGSRYADPNLL
ncbi:hypothetical protein BJX61DRAFT_20982 [Aspergillus egyptiacus]|nr:hypothetical protein BJX61DRAFT_20982 [Aspergillus egyptiacus]